MDNSTRLSCEQQDIGSMVWIAFVAFGSLALTAGAVVFVKQSLIDDAQAATKGYF